MSREESRWVHREAVIDGVRLHYVEAGRGPLVVLLHGFPEFWYSWRHQIPALAAAGYRVIAPDMRGYNTSDKPAGVSSYRIERLTADVAGLVRHAGVERASIVGHDWGGAIAWMMPAHYPALVERLLVLNAPHPRAFRRALGNSSQLLRSWYMLFFQVPGVPEMLLSARNYAGLERAFRVDPVRAGAFSEEDIALYREMWAQPGGLTAMIHYYRALSRTTAIWRFPKTLSCPTLLVWGERDRYLDLGLTEGLDRWVPGIRVVRLPGASHWVQVDAPEAVNRAMIDFLGEGRGKPSHES